MTSVKELILRVNNKPVTVEVKAVAFYDSNHGADADGNRGMGVWFIDDVTWDIPETDDDGNTLNEDEKQTLNDLLDMKVDDIDF